MLEVFLYFLILIWKVGLFIPFIFTYEDYG